jgi:predicted dehydrogenase
MKSVGIVGCGAVTRLLYAPLFPGLASHKVTHVCDLDRSRAKEVAALFDGALATDVDRLCNLVDCVVIATPPSSHYELGLRALRSSASMVVMEKPFVASQAQAVELVREAQRLGKSLFVGQFRRQLPQVQLAHRLIESGALGAVCGIEMYEGAPFGWHVSSDYLRKERTGGVLLDTGAHTLDQGLFVSGIETVPVTMHMRTAERDQPEPAHEIKVSFALQPTGLPEISATLFLSRYQTLANLLRIHCASAAVEFNAAVSDYVRLKSGEGWTVLRTSQPFKAMEEAFLSQYEAIFTGRGEMFAAERFVNQVALLEQILNYA